MWDLSEKPYMIGPTKYIFMRKKENEIMTTFGRNSEQGEFGIFLLWSLINSNSKCSISGHLKFSNTI